MNKENWLIKIAFIKNFFLHKKKLFRLKSKGYSKTPCTFPQETTNTIMT